LILDDCGVLGVINKDEKITTQSTQLSNPMQTGKNDLECESSFFLIKDTLPNPFNYLALRLMNLTLMRIGFLNEMLKKFMVRTLVKNSKRINMTRTRKVELKPHSIKITDSFKKFTGTELTGLSQGFKFTSIHMASARYFYPSQANPPEIQTLDHSELNNKGTLISHKQVFFKNLPDGR